MSSVHKLWLIKTGQSEGPTVNAAMRRGTKWESAARIAVEKATGIVIAPVFGEMDENPFVRASFDGMDFLQTSLVEIPGGHPKCPTYGHPNCSTRLGVT